eukprot:9493256-Pyramimonas_sp.AAC.1
MSWMQQLVLWSRRCAWCAAAGTMAKWSGKDHRASQHNPSFLLLPRPIPKEPPKSFGFCFRTSQIRNIRHCFCIRGVERPRSGH